MKPETFTVNIDKKCKIDTGNFGTTIEGPAILVVIKDEKQGNGPRPNLVEELVRKSNELVGPKTLKEEITEKFKRLINEHNLTADEAWNLMTSTSEGIPFSQGVRTMDETRYKEVLNETLDYLRNTLDDTYPDSADTRANTIVMLADKLFALDRKLI